jgi:hypothetical protein
VHLLKHKGLIYIEVPCFDWICKHKAWFDIFYEHVNYFRVSDFYRFFGKVYKSGWLFGKQYCYVIADLSSLRLPKFDQQDSIDCLTNFFPSLDLPHVEKNYQRVAWGGASKGVIFTLFMARLDQPVNVVIDINPAKQGKYLPATGLLVQSPEKALLDLPEHSVIFVMNSNYLEEIIEIAGKHYRYILIDHDGSPGLMVISLSNQRNKLEFLLGNYRNLKSHKPAS